MLLLIEEVFAAGGRFTFAPRGRSMLPTLAEGRDLVELSSPTLTPPRVGDILLYSHPDRGASALRGGAGAGELPPARGGEGEPARGGESEAAGEGLALHRLVKIARDGTLVLCGDAQTALERGVSPARVRGVVTAVIRGDRRLDAGSAPARAKALARALFLRVRAAAHAAAASLRRKQK